MSDLDVMVHHLEDLKNTIEECYAKGRYMPCLILLYAGIDAVASLEPSRGSKIGDRFVRWVDDYLLPRRAFNCSAIDLWAARCGVVHTFTPESELYKKGKARQVAYAFGAADHHKLEQVIELVKRVDTVSLHVRDLLEAFYDGILKYIEEVFEDPKRLAELRQNAGVWTLPVGSNYFDGVLNLPNP